MKNYDIQILEWSILIFNEYALEKNELAILN